MKNIVVAIDGTGNLQRAFDHIAELHQTETVRVHLLNVQPPFTRDICRFFSAAEIRDLHREEGMQALAPAIRMLEAAGIPHRDHVLVGHKAETIVSFACDYRCDQIVLGDPGRVRFAGLGLGSIGSQVRHLASAARFVCEVV